jgi:hypothetical protein
MDIGHEIEIDCGDDLEISKETERKLFEKGKLATCKIITEKGYDSGFFCIILFKNEKIKMLFTCNHVLNNESIQVGNIIKCAYKEKIKIIEITEERFCHTNAELDYTCIQIFNDDKIEDFFEIENENNKNPKDNYLNEDICIMQYPKGLLTLKVGHLKKIDKEQIQHSVTTFKGSSGSPIILLLRDHKIIGIHRGSNNSLNLGTSMIYIIEDINKKILPLMEVIGKWELR